MLFLFGINHKSAPIKVRELFAITNEKSKELVCELNSKLGAQAVLVSTCNRVEIYCYYEGKAKTLLLWLRSKLKGEFSKAALFSYRFNGTRAVYHLMRVVCGIDSMIVGETEILGQIKHQYKLAFNSGAVGKHLARLFQLSFSTAKQVRSNTSLGLKSTSIASQAVKLASEIFPDVASQVVLIIGIGSLNTGILKYLLKRGVNNFIIANRNINKALNAKNNLQEQYPNVNICVISLSKIKDYLVKSDIIISATGSNTHLISKDMLQKSTVARKRKPIVILDLAVPRDVAPDVKILQDIYLWNVDDLRLVIDYNTKQRKTAIIKADKYIHKSVHDYKLWLSELRFSGMIKDLSVNAKNICDSLVQEALEQLSSGRSAQVVIQRMAHLLTNKLMHNVIMDIKHKETAKIPEKKDESFCSSKKIFDEVID